MRQVNRRFPAIWATSWAAKSLRVRFCSAESRRRAGTNLKINVLPPEDIRRSGNRGKLGYFDLGSNRRIEIGVEIGGDVGSQAKRELPAGSNHIVVALVCFDDTLHEGMAYDIALIEIDEGDTFDTAQDFSSFEEAAPFAAGQI